MADMGSRVMPGQKVYVDGKAVVPEEENILIAVNKPRGIVCTTTDKQGANNIVDFLGCSKESTIRRCIMVYVFPEDVPPWFSRNLGFPLLAWLVCLDYLIGFIYQFPNSLQAPLHPPPAQEPDGNSNGYRTHRYHPRGTPEEL